MFLPCRGNAPAVVTTATAIVGSNEEEVGVGLQRAFDEGILTRSEVFVTSKLMPTNCSPGAVETALDLSLSKLKLA